MFALTLESDFAAAHHLEGYHGACAALHGHTWKVAVTIVANKTREIGMVLDFRDIKRYITKVTSQLDHGYLNRILPEGLNPTAENLSKWIYEELQKLLAPFEAKKICKLWSVTVWESSNASCTYNEQKIVWPRRRRVKAKETAGK